MAVKILALLSSDLFPEGYRQLTSEADLNWKTDLTAGDQAPSDSVGVVLCSDVTAFFLQLPIATVMHPTAPTNARGPGLQWEGYLLDSSVQ